MARPRASEPSTGPSWLGILGLALLFVGSPADLAGQVPEGEPGSPAWVEATEEEAQTLAEQGEPGPAAELYMALQRQAPNRPEAEDGRWALLAAQHYEAAGSWPEAAAAYREAVARGALSPVDGARRLGVALVMAGSPRDARDAFAGIPMDQRLYLDHRYLAMLAMEANDTTAALVAYRGALDVAPSASDSAANLRTLGYLMLGSDAEAAAGFLGRALELDPQPSLRLDLAGALLRTEQPQAALQALGSDASGLTDPQQLFRLDLLAEAHQALGDTTALLGILEEAAEQDPSAYRWSRLGFLRQNVGDHAGAAAAFARAHEAQPTAGQAAQVAYAYRRARDDAQAVAWFRRSIDGAREPPGDTGVDVDLLRREVAALSDRFSASFYSSFRGEGDPGSATGGVAQAGIASQGGLEVRYRPLLQRTSWGRDFDVTGRLFWAYENGLGINSDSYQAHLGVRYRPPFLPGSAVGVERWIGIGSLGLDAWAFRLQMGRLLGTPYPEPAEGTTFFASLYGDAAWLPDPGGSLLFGEARPGVAIPISERLTLFPHGTLSVYDQSLSGGDLSYIEGGPGFGARLRMPRSGEYTLDMWTVELMTQYRWGGRDGDQGSDRYGDWVLIVSVLF